MQCIYQLVECVPSWCIHPFHCMSYNQSKEQFHQFVCKGGFPPECLKSKILKNSKHLPMHYYFGPLSFLLLASQRIYSLMNCYQGSIYTMKYTHVILISSNSKAHLKRKRNTMENLAFVSSLLKLLLLSKSQGGFFKY